MEILGNSRYGGVGRKEWGGGGLSLHIKTYVILLHVLGTLCAPETQNVLNDNGIIFSETVVGHPTLSPILSFDLPVPDSVPLKDKCRLEMDTQSDSKKRVQYSNGESPASTISCDYLNNYVWLGLYDTLELQTFLAQKFVGAGIRVDPMTSEQTGL